jgi:hypothetical protein
LELDVSTNKADDATNPSWIGGAGIRSGIHLAGIRQITTDTTQTQIGLGVWLSTTDPAGSITHDDHTNFGSAFGFAKSTQTYSAYDARGAIAPTGSSAPVFGLNMDAGQAIEFNGDDTTLSPAARNTLLYDTGSTSLLYQVAGVTKAAISATGVFSSGATAGVSCSGAPTISFASVGGIVTHC